MSINPLFSSAIFASVRARFGFEGTQAPMLLAQPPIAPQQEHNPAKHLFATAGRTASVDIVASMPPATV